MPASSVVGHSATVEILNRYMGEGGESWIDIAQTIGLNCGVTHCPGKIEYNCRYFIMSFRKQIGEYKFGKNCFHTLQSTMSHRPLTNASSLKITAAYCALLACGRIFLVFPIPFSFLFHKEVVVFWRQCSKLNLQGDFSIFHVR